MILGLILSAIIIFFIGYAIGRDSERLIVAAEKRKREPIINPVSTNIVYKDDYVPRQYKDIPVMTKLQNEISDLYSAVDSVNNIKSDILHTIDSHMMRLHTLADFKKAILEECKKKQKEEQKDYIDV